MEENKELMDYVKEIRDLNKKRVFWNRLSVILLAVLVISMVSLLPIINKTLNNANTALDTAVEALNQAESIMGELNGTIDTMEAALSSVTKLADDSSKQLSTAFTNINSIDFEGLNDAIKDLGDVVEPLSNFFKKFR